ncbi:MAG TPA: hypothetical protein VGG72_36030 [Bryobacteraceae bacterium]|jgi:hypothetical protein
MTTRLQLELTKERVAEVEALMRELGLKTKTDLFNNALTLLEWAAKEKRRGRIIGSTDEEQQRFKEVLLPALETVARRREEVGV